MELSVILPCRDVAPTLGTQLDALTREEWDGEWEVVIVDNGSTDPTVAVAERYIAVGPPLRVIPAVEGSGVAYARNAGVAASGARSVAFCDGDDVVEPGWVRAMGMALRDHDIVTGSLDLERLNRPELAASRGSAASHAPAVFGGVPFARGNNCGVRRAVFDQVGGYDESFFGLEDIEFSLRAAALGFSVHFVPDARVQYRYRDGAAGLWQQGLFYGASTPALALRARALGLPAPSRTAGLRSWAWLVVHITKLARRDARLAWIWVLANRLGALRGSLKARSLYV
jgi:glycosyltransferase involved in cell wall biosynthesis